MRLYKDFARALAGTSDGALQLQVLDTSRLDENTGPDGNSEVDNTYQLIEIRGSEQGFRCMGQVTSYELVSERENIDTTALNQAYRQQYEAGLIQGSGRISAFWESELEQCKFNDVDRYPEVSYFLAAVILRLEQGADFGARFFLTDTDDRNTSQAMFYDCPKCVITNCTVSVEPTQVITADIDFVTTGKVRLKQGFAVDRLIPEDSPKRIGSEAGYIVDEFSVAPMELQNTSDN